VEIPQPQAPSPDAQATGAIAQLIHLVDIDLQVTLRLALGWKVEDVIADMQLKVPAPPAVVHELNRQQRRAKEREDGQ